MILANHLGTDGLSVAWCQINENCACIVKLRKHRGNVHMCMGARTYVSFRKGYQGTSLDLS